MKLFQPITINNVWRGTGKFSNSTISYISYSLKVEQLCHQRYTDELILGFSLIFLVDVIFL